MKLMFSVLCAAALLLPAMAFTQPQPAAVAAGVTAARQRSDSILKQYHWYCRVDVTKGGAVHETKIERINVLPGGRLEHTVINDTKAPLPNGFLRRVNAENERKQLDAFLHGLHELVDKYSLPGSATVGAFLGTAAIAPGTAADGAATLAATGTGVVVPGDSVTYVFDAKTFAAVRMECSTKYEGQDITVTTTFRTTPSGLTHPQYTTVNAPGKELVIQVHNYDYAPSN